MLTVWGRKTSSNVQALMWCIGELGLPFRRFDVGQQIRGQRHPGIPGDEPERHGARSSRTKTASRSGRRGAILRYLASRYADDAFWPRDVVRRAQVDKWAEWAKINIALNFTSPVFWQVVRTAPKDRNPRSLYARRCVCSADSSILPRRRSRTDNSLPAMISPLPISSSAMCSTAISTSNRAGRHIPTCGATTTP